MVGFSWQISVNLQGRSLNTSDEMFSNFQDCLVLTNIGNIQYFSKSKQCTYVTLYWSLLLTLCSKKATICGCALFAGQVITSAMLRAWMGPDRGPPYYHCLLRLAVGIKCVDI